jgi:hypothetical protein
MRWAALAPCAVLLFGCSSGDLGPSDAAHHQLDAAPQVDASNQADVAPPADGAPPADAVPQADALAPGDVGPVDGGAGCFAPTSYGDLGTRTEPVEADDLAVPTIVWATFELNAKPDTLKVDLYQGLGVFTESIHVGTFPLTGDELSYATCAACVHLTATGGGGGTQDYMATGGTLTISAVSPNLQATLSDITFEHVIISGSVSTPVGDGCVSAVSHLVIDSPLSNE